MADLNEFDVFYRNAGSALEVIGSFPSSYFHRFPGLEAFIMATGIRSADENWAWIKSNSYSRELLIEVISKFEERQLQFIWPVFPDSSVQMGLDMDELGLVVREVLNAMIFDSAFVHVNDKSGDLKLKTTKALTSKDATLWADTCWRGFAKEKETLQPEFVRFAQSAVLNDKLSLVLGYVENEPVGTFMLCENEGFFISHFSVLPEWRNLGIGSLLMNELMNYTYFIKKRYLVLIATKQGERLYKKFGFKNVGSISIRSLNEFT